MFLTSAKLDWSIRRQVAVLAAGIPTAGPVTHHITCGGKQVMLHWGPEQLVPIGH